MNAVTKTESSAVSTAATEATEATRYPTFRPKVDIRETESAILLSADMPGCDEQSVSIELEGSILTIRGHSTLKTPAGFTQTTQEYQASHFEREFTLGESIDRSAITATVKDGVLRLTLAKAQDAKPRRIAVQAG